MCAGLFQTRRQGVAANVETLNDPYRFSAAKGVDNEHAVDAGPGLQMRGLHHVGQVPRNPHEGCDFKRPAETVIQAFYGILFDKNFTVIIRRSKGQDISAACGQLRARSMGA